MTVHLGIIGCGFIGGIHSIALRGLIRGGLVDARVVAVCDSDAARAEAFARAHDGCAATSEPTEVIDAVDAVWVCTPTSTHPELVASAATRGRAVYCEKPLAPTLPEVEEMAVVVDKAGIAHQVGLVLRSARPVAELRRRTAEAAVGRPMAAVLRDDQYFPIQGRYASRWRSDATQAGGGTLIEHSIHDLDLLAWVLGPVTEVGCRTANFAAHAGIEDVAVATLAHQSGATSSLVSVWHQVLARPSLRRLEVFCERALLWLDDEGAGPLHVETDGGHDVVDVPTGHGWLSRLVVREEWRPGLAPYAAADRSFLAALDAGTPPAPGFERAVAAHRVADACYRSAATGGMTMNVALL